MGRGDHLGATDQASSSPGSPTRTNGPRPRSRSGSRPRPRARSSSSSTADGRRWGRRSRRPTPTTRQDGASRSSGSQPRRRRWRDAPIDRIRAVAAPRPGAPCGSRPGAACATGRRRRIPAPLPAPADHRAGTPRGNGLAAPERYARARPWSILQILAFVAGVTLIVITIASAVRTFLVPRALQTTLARTVFIGVRRLFRLRARPSVEYEHRDRIMAFYAPVALLVLLLVWIVIVLAGYTLLFWAVADVSLHGAALLAGSSMFTLGFVSPDESLVTALGAFSAAGVGLVLLALFITYLPSLYGAFARREQGVSKLEVRAGQPPTGVYLLELSWIGRTHGEPARALDGVGGLVHRRGREPQLVPLARRSSARRTRTSRGSRPPARSWTGRRCSSRAWTCRAIPSPTS